jgi:HK97 family phage prohead protease
MEKKKLQFNKSYKKTKRFIATKEVADSDNEIVKVDGIDMERYKKNPVFIWGHKTAGDVYDVLGQTKEWDIETDKDGVKMLTFAVDYADHQKAQDAKAMHEKGMGTGISIGFRVPKDGYQPYEEEMGGVINKSELYEISNVIVGANPEALQFAKSHKLLTEQEEKRLIMERNYPIYKEKIKYFRKKFLSKELCESLGYEKTGTELEDISKIYDKINKCLKELAELTEQQSKKVTNTTTLDYITLEDAKKKIQEAFNKL